MTVGLLLLLAVVVGGLYMAWGIGANDVANAMGTSVGSGALTLIGAIVLAGVLEFTGAVAIGSNVTQTISKGIIDTAMFASTGHSARTVPSCSASACCARSSAPPCGCMLPRSSGSQFRRRMQSWVRWPALAW